MSNTVQEQIVREASDIEKAKVGLMSSAKAQVDAANAAAAQGRYLTPDYNVQGMTRDQLDAIQLGRQGIGAYQPYMNAATQGAAAGASTLGEAANVLRGADTRNQFGAAQAAMNNAALPINQMTAAANLTSQGVPLIQQGAQGMADAQRLSLASTNQPGFQQGIGSLYGAAEAARTAAQLGAAPTAQSAQTGYNPSLLAFQMGPAERLQTQSITAPGSAQQYMSPYQQAVTDIGVREAQRQDDIARQGRNAAAVKSGAFGGSRQAIMESEAARNLSQLKADIQNKGSQEAYMAGQQQFNAEQQARLAAQQANQQAGLTIGQQNLAALQNTQQLGTQTGLQTSLANLSNQQQTNLANQALQGQYGLSGAQFGLQAAQQQAAAGTGQIGATAQQAGIQQNAANMYGNLAGQQAGLASMYGNLGAQQAGILGQQSQLNQSLGQGIGSLASQQFGVGQSMAQGLGSLGTQQSNLAMQQAALGQNAQALGQQDTNFLYNLGSAEQRQKQAELDATRQNQLTKNMQPYQQMGYLSDIYKGAPSSQMAVTTQSQAAPSPFQQIAGLGTGIMSTAAAGKVAGII